MHLFPYGLIRWGIRRINTQERQPAVIYLHPWELDPDQPRLQGSWLSRFRHYHNLEKTETRFRRLLEDFRFETMAGVLRKQGLLRNPLTVSGKSDDD